MWYVVQVQARHEIVVCGQMRERVLTENEDAFVLQAERRHRLDDRSCSGFPEIYLRGNHRPDGFQGEAAEDKGNDKAAGKRRRNCSDQ